MRADEHPRRRQTPSPREPVVIVGGGWTGLSAAVTLSRHDAPVIVLEAARQLGGRARAARFGPFHVDNGQHILLGAFRSVLETLRTLGVSEASVFRRQPLRLLLVGAAGKQIEIKTDRLPAPLHLISGLLRSRGLSLGARRAAIRLLHRMWRQNFELAPDQTLESYLAEQAQPREAVRALWQPLCYAALNTPLESASARLFLHTVRDMFFRHRRDCDFLLPALDLSACLPAPATDFIESRGGSVRLNARVEALELDNGAITGVRVNDSVIPANAVILATSPHAAAELMAPHAALALQAQALQRLRTQPICTLYLRYPEAVALERDFVGLLDALPQWLFDRGRLSGDKGLIAAVVCGPGAHLRLNNEALTERIIADIAQRFPAWPRPLETKLVREKQATIAATAGVDELRPGFRLPVQGLWLAGDYMATGYPSTLEAAVTSGVLCARWVLRHRGHAHSSSTISEEL